MPTVRLRHLEYHVVRTATRFPFRYGIAAMTAAPHLFLKAAFEIGGETITGYSSEGLPPKWFVKSPDTSFDEDLPDMIEAIGNAERIAIDGGEAPSFFDWWLEMYRDQEAWSVESECPPLLAHLGTSLVERAGIDAFCRSQGIPFAEAVRSNALELRLGEIHSELEGRSPGDLMQQGRTDESTLLIRHTVGLADPLTDADILEEDRVDDGLPHSLEANVREYGLRFFKIKLSGQAAHDAARLRQLKDILERLVPGYRYTLDGNEQFRDLAGFRTLWDELSGDPALADFLSDEHLVFVEQPIHRDVALDDGVGEAIREWPECPPMIIDESDATLDSASRALSLGYGGTSHKNCKGVIKGIANACLLKARASRNPGREGILSGEDLANVGPVALLQDLAVMHALGIRHVERNGHHYFPGLSMFGPAIQSAALTHHGDLYREHATGEATFPALAIEEGKIGVDSVIAAPFGTAFEMDAVISDWRSLDEWTSDGAFRGY